MIVGLTSGDFVLATKFKERLVLNRMIFLNNINSKTIFHSHRAPLL